MNIHIQMVVYQDLSEKASAPLLPMTCESWNNFEIYFGDLRVYIQYKQMNQYCLVIRYIHLNNSSEFVQVDIAVWTKWSTFRRLHLKWNFSIRDYRVLIQISLSCVHELIDNKSALVEEMIWHRTGKYLNQLGLMMHLCFSKLGHHLFMMTSSNGSIFRVTGL